MPYLVGFVMVFVFAKYLSREVDAAVVDLVVDSVILSGVVFVNSYLIVVVDIACTVCTLV